MRSPTPEFSLPLPAAQRRRLIAGHLRAVRRTAGHVRRFGWPAIREGVQAAVWVGLVAVGLCWLVVLAAVCVGMLVVGIAGLWIIGRLSRLSEQ